MLQFLLLNLFWLHQITATHQISSFY
uniref:Uncharacterized protein n=1 Tax=Arundo donax TaxID=35708 RepID=A0A0A9HW20_ARUDO